MNAHAVYAKVSPIFRRRRMDLFNRIIAPQPTDRILDIGGTPWFWTGSAVPRSNLWLANVDDDIAQAAIEHGMHFVKADGCALPFDHGSFDVVVANSVIEHVGTWERQKAFAAEARRIGRRLWIQTPAWGFPLEPHLLTPCIHWMPVSLQRHLIRNATLRGWIDRPDRAAVETFLREVRLLNGSEMAHLFPDCTIHRERFLGLTKSFVAIRTP